MPSSDQYWLEHCPKPRARPAGIDWDVFISYRSADRVWALALYDMLQQAGYKVFLDQYVLAAGSSLLTQISENLRRSASGVIVWSSRSIDSDWVESEVGAMVERRNATKKTDFPFHFVATKLDAQELPELLKASIYIDFSSYPDGPTGAELIRLVSGLRGAPLDSPAVERIAHFESQVREEPAILRGLMASKQFDAIVQRALGEAPSDGRGASAYGASATLPALAAQFLINGKRYEDALKVIADAQQRFRKSLRLRQLRGLALRRMGAIKEAIGELETLRAEGHNDPETLGILAAALTSSWQKSGDRDELELARDLYRQAFARTPTDTYSGINAASKSAMLGELPLAQELARTVLKRLKEKSDARGGEPSADYWERVTEPEAQLLLGKFEEALSLYHSARIAHQAEIGSIESTATQLKLLVELPFVPGEWRTRFQEEFKKFWPKPT